MKKALLFIPVILFVTGFIFLGCQTETSNPMDSSIDKKTPVSCTETPSTRGIVPTQMEGNTPPVNEYNVKIDPPTPATITLGSGSVTFEINETACGQVVSWSITGNIRIDYVYIKGGATFNEYDYTNYDYSNDGNLHSPVNSSGKYADVSHLNFLWSPTTGDCETAFAYAENKSTCFSDISELNADRWGWSIGPVAPGETVNFNIYAAAGQCNLTNGYLAGTGSFTYNMDGTYVKSASGDNLGDIVWYIGSTTTPMKNGKPTVAPGQYYIETGLTGDVYFIVHGNDCP